MTTQTEHRVRPLRNMNENEMGKTEQPNGW